MMERIRRVTGDDEGIGMILVIAMVGILTTLMVVMTAVGVTSLRSSRKHVSFEGALSAAESGIDEALARAQKAYNTGGSDSYATPSATDPNCTLTSVAWPFTSQPTPSQEQAWAKSTLQSIATTASCRSRSADGDFVYLKPTGHQAVYAMGFSPSYGANEMKTRLLKAEYLFTPYAPTNAILTGKSVTLGSSTTVTTAPPSDPTLAAVHTNGNLYVDTGNPTVYGPVSQSGTGTAVSSNKFYGNTGGTVTTTVKQSIPAVSAFSVWSQNHATTVAGGWYDLCLDGTARLADGSAPCAGTVVSSSGSWRGWTFNSAPSVKQWIATSAIMQNGYSGTYYVDGADAIDNASNSGSNVPNLTVIAATHSSGCNKVGGNISWDHIDIAAPSVPNLFMLADQDLLTTSNFSAGSDVNGTVISGLFIAGDQIQMETSSNGAYGAVVAADQCSPAPGTSLVDTNYIKNPSIYYDPNAKAPFVSLINTTLWLEYGV